MPTHYRHAQEYLKRLLRGRSPEEVFLRFAPHTDPAPPKVGGGSLVTPEAIERRWDLLAADPATREALADTTSLASAECYHHNIEHFIGTVKVPVGLAGPLRINGLFAYGDFYIPLATTEAALVASYDRGTHVITEAGGCAAALVNEGLSRSPAFAFRDFREAAFFVAWAVLQQDAFREAAEATTRFGRLIDMRVTAEGNHIYLDFEFTTGDAAGQNMVTIATDAICRYIEQQSPVKPRYYFVESNLSGDKKASAQSFISVRGRKVTAEVILPPDLVERRLHTTPGRMVECWQMSAIGGVMGGSIGIQGHYANGLAALYIACGQDAACVAESAVGITRFELVDGALYAAVTLPNLIVGTVGGGTGLPSQHACLEILGLSGAGNAQALAEVCAGLALAGELSIVGSVSAGDFSRSHQRLARGR